MFARTRTARPYEFVHRARSFEVMPKASLLLPRGFHERKHSARSRGVAHHPRLPLAREGDHVVVVGEFQMQSYFPTNADAQSAPLRRLAVFYSSAVAINQSKRLRTECRLTVALFRRRGWH